MSASEPVKLGDRRGAACRAHGGACAVKGTGWGFECWSGSDITSPRRSLLLGTGVCQGLGTEGLGLGDPRPSVQEQRIPTRWGVELVSPEA